MPEKKKPTPRSSKSTWVYSSGLHKPPRLYCFTQGWSAKRSCRRGFPTPSPFLGATLPPFVQTLSPQIVNVDSLIFNTENSSDPEELKMSIAELKETLQSMSLSLKFKDKMIDELKTGKFLQESLSIVRTKAENSMKEVYDIQIKELQKPISRTKLGKALQEKELELEAYKKKWSSFQSDTDSTIRQLRKEKIIMNHTILNLKKLCDSAKCDLNAKANEMRKLVQKMKVYESQESQNQMQIIRTLRKEKCKLTADYCDAQNKIKQMEQKTFSPEENGTQDEIEQNSKLIKDQAAIIQSLEKELGIVTDTLRKENIQHAKTLQEKELELEEYKNKWKNFESDELKEKDSTIKQLQKEKCIMDLTIVNLEAEIVKVQQRANTKSEQMMQLVEQMKLYDSQEIQKQIVIVQTLREENSQALNKIKQMEQDGTCSVNEKENSKLIIEQKQDGTCSVNEEENSKLIIEQAGIIQSLEMDKLELELLVESLRKNTAFWKNRAKETEKLYKPPTMITTQVRPEIVPDQDGSRQSPKEISPMEVNEQSADSSSELKVTVGTQHSERTNSLEEPSQSSIINNVLPLPGAADVEILGFRTKTPLAIIDLTEDMEENLELANMEVINSKISASFTTDSQSSRIQEASAKLSNEQSPALFLKPETQNLSVEINIVAQPSVSTNRAETDTQVPSSLVTETSSVEDCVPSETKPVQSVGNNLEMESPRPAHKDSKKNLKRKCDVPEIVTKRVTRSAVTGSIN